MPSLFFSACYQEETLHDLVIIYFPKSKLELTFTLAMLSACTDKDSRILIVGEKKSRKIEAFICHFLKNVHP